MGFGVSSHAQPTPQGPQPYYPSRQSQGSQEDSDRPSGSNLRPSSSKSKQKDLRRSKTQKTYNKSSSRGQPDFQPDPEENTAYYGSVASFKVNGYVNDPSEQGQMQASPHYSISQNPPNMAGRSASACGGSLDLTKEIQHPARLNMLANITDTTTTNNVTTLQLDEQKQDDSKRLNTSSRRPIQDKTMVNTVAPRKWKVDMTSSRNLVTLRTIPRLRQRHHGQLARRLVCGW
jgi:hypothetical protein